MGLNNLKKVDFYINFGAIELLKYLAFVFMVADHINTYLYNQQFIFPYEIGRLAMPIFCFTYAYGLATADAKKTAVVNLLDKPFFVKIFNFLLVAVISSLFISYLSEHHYPWYPLNIIYLFTFFIL